MVLVHSVNSGKVDVRAVNVHRFNESMNKVLSKIINILYEGSVIKELVHNFLNVEHLRKMVKIALRI